MPNLSLEITVGVLTVLPFVFGYWVARFVSRRRLAAGLRASRALQAETLRGWMERGWVDEQQAALLPSALEPARVFYEWAWADPEIVRVWRLRGRVDASAPIEALVADAWESLPRAEQERSRERLTAAVRAASTWWGGAERGWNRRPLAVLSSAMPRKRGSQPPLPLLPMDDLTAAPVPGPVQVEALTSAADGPELVLALALLRHASFRFTHPLAPRAGATGSLIQGLSARVATDLGRKVGAGLGAALGPIGSMVGQYVGELVGTLGGKALADQTMPAPISNALRETETGLAQLGELARTAELEAVVQEPVDAVLAHGRTLEAVREERSRRLRERLWPTAGLALVEETLRVALAELDSYRAAAKHFTAAVRGAEPVVAGGMLLQNPWMVRRLQGGVERLNAARSALNRAATTLQRLGSGK